MRGDIDKGWTSRKSTFKEWGEEEAENKRSENQEKNREERMSRRKEVSKVSIAIGNSSKIKLPLDLVSNLSLGYFVEIVLVASSEWKSILQWNKK